MARIERKNLKVFAENAANTGQFGSAQNGTKVTTTDPEEIQALDAWGAGWINATIGGSRLPALEELQATVYFTTYHMAYLFQEGIAEWNAETIYHTNSFIKDGIKIYYSLQDDNQGNAISESGFWAEWRLGETWQVGDVKQSILPADAFILLNGDDWVPMDGTDVTGSMYETLTGNSTVPDATGAFIRCVGGAALGAGETQQDATARNGLNVSWSSSNLTTGTKTVSWASANATTASYSHKHSVTQQNSPAGYQQESKGWLGSPYENYNSNTNTVGGGLTLNKNQLNSNQTAHSHTFNKNILNSGQAWGEDEETRPLNMAVNYFIKVN